MIVSNLLCYQCTIGMYIIIKYHVNLLRFLFFERPFSFAENFENGVFVEKIGFVAKLGDFHISRRPLGGLLLL